MSVLLELDCPDCGSLDTTHLDGEIRCNCLSCGFWWNEYDSADE